MHSNNPIRIKKHIEVILYYNNITAVGIYWTYLYNEKIEWHTGRTKLKSET